MNRNRLQRILMVVALFFGLTHSSSASEIGHYAPGVPSIRDFVMPDPGFYGVIYNYRYATDRLNDRNGDVIRSVSINPGPGPGVTLGVDVDVDMYAIAPTFIWVSDWKILGAKYGAYISPTFANASIGAALTTTTGSGRGIQESQFDAGDLFVQPLWLGWGLTNWDFTLGYGFYAPLGRYETEAIPVPLVGPILTEATDNIGLGFWTHQVQGSIAWYPWAHKATGVSATLTYENHHEKEDFDLTPGQNLTLNWGISQYLPLTKDQSLLLELGPAGYSSWQITDDRGSAVRNPGVHDQVHAAGGQLGLTYVPWMLSAGVNYFYEHSAVDRFQGQSLGFTIAKKF